MGADWYTAALLCCPACSSAVAVEGYEALTRAAHGIDLNSVSQSGTYLLHFVHHMFTDIVS